MNKNGDYSNLSTRLSEIIKLYTQRSRMIMQRIGLFHSQAPLIFYLMANPTSNQREIAHKLHVTPATINVMVKRMEKNGWLTREADPQDGRVTLISLSDKGQEIVKEVNKGMNQVETELTEGMSDAERNMLDALLLHMRNNLYRVCDVDEDLYDDDFLRDSDS